MSGEKLPPFLVFTGKRTGRIIREVTGDVESRGYPSNVVMSVQQKAWMDETLMQEWIDRVWMPWVVEHQATYTYLIMDSLAIDIFQNLTFIQVHMMGSVVNRLATLNTQAEIIVPGYTSKLQVLDVGVNRPFKCYVANEYNAHLIQNGSKPNRQDIAHWVNRAWKGITEDTILNTWDNIGYTT